MENFKQKLTEITDKINSIEKPNLKEMIEAIRSNLPEINSFLNELHSEDNAGFEQIGIVSEYIRELTYATDINLDKINNHEEEDSKVDEMWSRISRFQDKMLSEL